MPKLFVIRFSDAELGLLETIRVHAKASGRSTGGYIRHLLKVAMIAKKYPELTLAAIEEELITKAETEAGLNEQ